MIMKVKEKVKENELKLEFVFDLINAFSIVQSPEDTAFFIQDLLTAKEVENLSKRPRIAKHLLKGESHRDISMQLGVSTSTVLKVSLWLKQGGEGFEKVIARLPKKYEMPKKLPKKPLEFQGPQVLATLVAYGLHKNQDKKLKKFVDRMKGKGMFDKKYREAVSDYYK